MFLFKFDFPGHSVISKPMPSRTVLPYNVTSQDQLSVEYDDPERSDPIIKSDSLPENHLVHLLPEARMHYEDIRPPFVLGRRSEVSKTVVLPTKSGARPKDEKAIKVKIVAKICALGHGLFRSVHSLKAVSLC